MSDMKKAYEVAAIAVRQRLAEQRPEDLHILNKLRKQDVAVGSAKEVMMHCNDG